MRFVIAFLILLLSYSVKAQNQEKIDSLRNVVETADNDTTKVNALIALGIEFIASKPDTCLELAIQALELSNTLEFIKGQADAYRNIGYANYVQSDYDKAITNWQKTLELNTQRGYKRGVAASANNIGLIYWNQSNYPLALKYYFKSLKLEEELLEGVIRSRNAEKIEIHKLGIAMSYNNIGVVYEEQFDPSLALEYYLKSLKIYEELGDSSLALANSYINIGLIYWRQSDHLLARTYFFKSLKICEELGDKRGIATAYTNIGILHTSISKSLVNINSDPQVFGGMGRSAAHLDTALHYQQKSYELQKELSSEYGMFHSINGLGSIYAQKKDYSQALKYYQQAVVLADSINALNEESSVHKSLAAVYGKLGNYELALKHFKQYSSLKDSIFNEDKSKDLGKLEAKHEFETAEAGRKRQEREIEKLEATVKSRRDNLQYSGILIFIVLVFAGVFALGRISIPIRLAEGLIFFSFLLFFEFTLVLLDPYIEHYSSGAPAIKLGFNAVLAAMIFPLHSLFEEKLKGRLVK